MTTILWFINIRFKILEKCIVAIIFRKDGLNEYISFGDVGISIDGTERERYFMP